MAQILLPVRSYGFRYLPPAQMYDVVHGKGRHSSEILSAHNSSLEGTMRLKQASLESSFRLL